MATKTATRKSVKKPVATKTPATKPKAKPKAKTPAKKVARKPAPKPAAKKKLNADKLQVVARSIRGIRRNLRNHATKPLTVAKVKGEFHVFKAVASKGHAAATKTGKVVKHDGTAVKSIGQLTYGQWVTACQKSA